METPSAKLIADKLRELANQINSVRRDAENQGISVEFIDESKYGRNRPSRELNVRVWAETEY